MRRRVAGVAAVCAVTWIVAFSLWRTSPASFDFIALYSSARLVALGRAAEVADRDAIAVMEHETRPERTLFLNNPNPPALSLLLAPLGALPFALAYAIWLALLVAATAVAAHLLAGTRVRHPALLFAAALIAPPALVAFVNGQTTPFLLLALAAALRAPARWSGLLLASTALRPQLLPLFAVVALADRERRWPFVAGVLAVIAVSLALIGGGGTAGYLDLVTSSAAESRPVDLGLVSLLRRVLGLGDATSTLAISSALLAAGAVVLLRLPARRRLTDACAWALVAAPHALPHDGVVAYPAIARRATSPFGTVLWVGGGLVVAFVHQAGVPIASVWLVALALSPDRGER